MYRFKRGPWARNSDSLRFIHKVNDESGAEKVFGAPVFQGDRDWCGNECYVEEYAECWLVQRKGNKGTFIIPTSDRAKAVMEMAAAKEVTA